MNALWNCIAWPPWGYGVLPHLYLTGRKLRMQLWLIQVLYVYLPCVNQIFEVAYLRDCQLRLHLGEPVIYLVLEAIFLVSSGCHCG